MTYGYHRPHHEKNIYVYVCICIYVHICICICTCIHRCIYAYTTRRTTPQQAPTHNTPHNPQIQGAFHLWIRVYVYVTYEYSRHTTRRAAPQPAPAHTPPHTSIVSATEIPSFDDPLDPPPKKNPPPPLLFLPTWKNIEQIIVEGKGGPPKNGEITLWPNTRVVKRKYYVSQKWNTSNHKPQWYKILLTCMPTFTARHL